MQFSVDLPVFFSDFAVAATLDGASLRGILEETPADSFNIIGGSGLRFLARASDIPIDPRGLPLIVDGVNYTVVDWESAGAGISALKLETA
jgi:hypothetical protein